MFPPPVASYVQDSDGFTPPAGFGGTVAVKYATLAYTDTTAKSLFFLPAGAVVVDIRVNINTAFNSSGTDLLDIGTVANGAAYANDLNVAATGQIPNGFVPGGMFATPLAVDTVVTGTYIQSVADASAGALTVCFFYIMKGS